MSEVDPARALAVAADGQAAMQPQQQSALQLLQAGRSMVETAQTVGVARATIYNWLKHDPAFLAALQLLKGLGMIRPREEAEKITDAGEIDTRMKLAEKKRKVAIKNEDNDLKFKESIADLGI